MFLLVCVSGLYIMLLFDFTNLGSFQNVFHNVLWGFRAGTKLGTLNSIPFHSICFVAIVIRFRNIKVYSLIIPSLDASLTSFESEHKAKTAEKQAQSNELQKGSACAELAAGLIC